MKPASHETIRDTAFSYLFIIHSILSHYIHGEVNGSIMPGATGDWYDIIFYLGLGSFWQLSKLLPNRGAKAWQRFSLPSPHEGLLQQAWDVLDIFSSPKHTLHFNLECRLNSLTNFKKHNVRSPIYGLYLFLNYRPFKPLLNYQHGRFWGYALCIHHVYTSRFSFPQWHGLTQAHLPPRSRKTARHSDITFRKL